MEMIWSVRWTNWCWGSVYLAFSKWLSSTSTVCFDHDFWFWFDFDSSFFVVLSVRYWRDWPSALDLSSTSPDKCAYIHDTWTYIHSTGRSYLKLKLLWQSTCRVRWLVTETLVSLLGLDWRTENIESVPNGSWNDQFQLDGHYLGLYFQPIGSTLVDARWLSRRCPPALTRLVRQANHTERSLPWLSALVLQGLESWQYQGSTLLPSHA